MQSGTESTLLAGNCITKLGSRGLKSAASEQGRDSMRYVKPQRRRVPAGMIEPLDDVIKRKAQEALDLCYGDVIMASRLLGIGKTTYYRWLRKWEWSPILEQAKALARSSQ
jgi:transcriptional regulator of acetoin/glycerol metabolism